MASLDQWAPKRLVVARRADNLLHQPINEPIPSESYMTDASSGIEQERERSDFQPLPVVHTMQPLVVWFKSHLFSVDKSCPTGRTKQKVSPKEYKGWALTGTFLTITNFKVAK